MQTQKGDKNMKKTLSILLAVILAFSAFTMVSFAEETEITDVTEVVTDAPADSTDTPADTPDKPQNIEDTLFYKWANDNNWNSLDDVQFSGKLTQLDNEGKLATGDCYFKGGKMVVDVPLEISGFKGLLNFKTQTAKAWLAEFPFFYLQLGFMALGITTESAIALPIPFLKEANLVLEDTYEENGYYVEKIKNTKEGTVNYCYFKDGKLAYSESYYYGTKIEMIEFLSYEVSDKDVRGPIFAINLTPLLILFGLFGI